MKDQARNGLEIDRLFAVIKARRGEDSAHSYTADLLESGVARCARKLGEEALETLLAAVAGEREAVIAESADLIYHWLVLLAASGIKPQAVYEELAQRGRAARGL